MAESSEPLALTVHSMPQPGAALVRQRSAGRIKMLLVLLVCAAPVLASYYRFYLARPATVTAYSSLIQPSVALPDISALALDGKPQAMRGLAGQWLLVVLGSGACDTACERRLFMQRQLREMTGREAERIEKIWLVIDDLPLAPALQKALSETPAMSILRLPRAAAAAWLKPAPGQALEDHLYIVDPLGEWMMRAPADADPSRLKRDIERLLRASAGWDKPGRQALIETPGPAAAPDSRPAAKP